MYRSADPLQFALMQKRHPIGGPANCAVGPHRMSRESPVERLRREIEARDGGERLGEAWVRAHRRGWPGCLCRMAQPAASASCLSQLPQNSGEFTSHVRCVPVGVQRIGGSSVSGLSLSGIPLSGIPVSGIPVSELFGHHSPRPLTSGVREFPSQRLPGVGVKRTTPGEA